MADVDKLVSVFDGFPPLVNSVSDPVTTPELDTPDENVTVSEGINNDDPWDVAGVTPDVVSSADISISLDDVSSDVDEISLDNVDVRDSVIEVAIAVGVNR